MERLYFTCHVVASTISRDVYLFYDIRLYTIHFYCECIRTMYYTMHLSERLRALLVYYINLFNYY